MKKVELTGYEPTVMSADLIHEAMRLDGQRVRKWRHKGDFTGGEKMGKTYLYTIHEIAKLVIMTGMLDGGFSTHTASVAAEMACNTTIAHCLRRAPLLSIWTAPEEVELATETIRSNPALVRDIFTPDDNSWMFTEPHTYLVTGRDDIDDWRIADVLDFPKEDFILPTTYIDLREAADRVIYILEAFAVSQLHPTERNKEPGPMTQAAFYSKRWNETDDTRVTAIALDPAVPSRPENYQIDVA
jgi:hypothetical protein